MINPEDQKQVAEAKRLMYLMVERAQSMGGTCTGEHGIGVGKIQMLQGNGRGIIKVDLPKSLSLIVVCCCCRWWWQMRWGEVQCR